MRQFRKNGNRQLSEMARQKVQLLILTIGISFLILLNVSQPSLARTSEQDGQTGQNHQDFVNFLNHIWPEARRKGIKRSTYITALQGITPDPEILHKQENQPEFISPVWAYIEGAVSEKRLTYANEALKKHQTLLRRIEKDYGVSRHIILAIWGLESTFGRNTGSKSVIRSLATLAYKGRRMKYGKAQLFEALKIIQKGDIAPQNMTGSWAGAMGQTQFIPGTYNLYSVDYDGDGKRDIWNNLGDALASTANLLKKVGWRTGQTWGYEVVLPPGFDFKQTGWKRKKTLASWRRMGVKRVKGKPFPRPSDKAALLLPAGAKGPAFLALPNFRAIMRYNQAVSYVLAVGHLADRCLGGDPFVQAWPKDDKPLARKDRKELQRLLLAEGLLNGKVDGVIGRKTIVAVRTYQQRTGLPADGYVSHKLLSHLRRKHAR